jgi:uncharacterized DUF497 family protein
MEELQFEWDAKKSRSNEVKHGVAFDEARSAFRPKGSNMRGSYHEKALRFHEIQTKSFCANRKASNHH